MSKRWALLPALLGATAVVAACGGGGGASSNVLPVVNAGPDQNASGGAAVTLPSFATDADGSVVSHRWSQFSGPVVTLLDADQSTARFTAPVVGVPTSLLFRLDVTDDQGGVSSDGVYVNIAGPEISIDASQPVAPIKATHFGINGDPFTRTSGTVLVDSYRSIKTQLLRWPSGFADGYHWKTGGHCQFGATHDPFDDFVTGVVQPLGAQMMINVNYGSNPDCNGPADPQEAVDWVDYANNQKHYGIQYWSIGNELYYESSYDLHAKPRDPLTYATAVAEEFYPRMKAKDPSIQIGVVVGANQTNTPDWDQIVLAKAKYDFVEMHNYPQDAGFEDDAKLLATAVDAFPAGFAKLRSELALAGKPDTPIFLAEFNSVNTNPGKQTLSIVNALFIGMAYVESLKAKVEMIAPHSGPSYICFPGNAAATLYGWQSFGTYGAFSTGAPTFISPGPGECDVPAAGTAFPFGRALQLIAAFAAPGENLLKATLSSAKPNVRVYAATRGSGYTVLLFNLDKDQPVTLALGLGNTARATYSATLQTYDKAIYDQSASGLWLPPTSQTLDDFTTLKSLTLSPWSMNVLILQ